MNLSPRQLPTLFVLLAMSATSTAAGTLLDAASRDNQDAVRALLQGGADVNEAQGDGMTALHWAAETGNAEIAAMLVYAGGNLALSGGAPFLMQPGATCTFVRVTSTSWGAPETRWCEIGRSE